MQGGGVGAAVTVVEVDRIVAALVVVLIGNIPMVGVASGLGDVDILAVVDGQVERCSGSATVGIGNVGGVGVASGVGQAGNIPSIALASNRALGSILRGVDGEAEVSGAVAAIDISVVERELLALSVGLAVELIAIASGDGGQGDLLGLVDGQAQGGDAVASVSGAAVVVHGVVTTVGQGEAVPIVADTGSLLNELLDLVVDGEVEGDGAVASNRVATSDGVLNAADALGVGLAVNPGVGVADGGVLNAGGAAVDGNSDLVGAGATLDAGVVVSVGIAGSDGLDLAVGPSHLIGVASDNVLEDGAAVVVDGEMQGGSGGAAGDRVGDGLGLVAAFGVVEGLASRSDGPSVAVASRGSLLDVIKSVDGQVEGGGGSALVDIGEHKAVVGGGGVVMSLTGDLPVELVAGDGGEGGVLRSGEGQVQSGGAIAAIHIGGSGDNEITLGVVSHVGVIPVEGVASLDGGVLAAVLIVGEVESDKAVATGSIGQEEGSLVVALGVFDTIDPGVSGVAAGLYIGAGGAEAYGDGVVDNTVLAKDIHKDVSVDTAGEDHGVEAAVGIGPVNRVALVHNNIDRIIGEDSLIGGILADDDVARVGGVAVVPTDEVEAGLGCGRDADDVAIGVGAGTSEGTTSVAVGGQGNGVLVEAEVGGVGDIGVVVIVHSEERIGTGIVAAPIDEVVAILGSGNDGVFGVGLEAGDTEVQAVGTKDLIVLVANLDITHLLDGDGDGHGVGLIVEVGGVVDIAGQLEGVACICADLGIVVVVVGPVDELVASSRNGGNGDTSAMVDAGGVTIDGTHAGVVGGNGDVDVVLVDGKVGGEVDVSVDGNVAMNRGGFSVAPVDEVREVAFGDSGNTGKHSAVGILSLTDAFDVTPSGVVGNDVNSVGVGDEGVVEDDVAQDSGVEAERAGVGVGAIAVDDVEVLLGSDLDAGDLGVLNLDRFGVGHAVDGDVGAVGAIVDSDGVGHVIEVGGQGEVGSGGQGDGAGEVGTLLAVAPAGEHITVGRGGGDSVALAEGGELGAGEVVVEHDSTASIEVG